MHWDCSGLCVLCGAGGTKQFKDGHGNIRQGVAASPTANMRDKISSAYTARQRAAELDPLQETTLMLGSLPVTERDGLFDGTSGEVHPTCARRYTNAVNIKRSVPCATVVSVAARSSPSHRHPYYW